MMGVRGWGMVGAVLVGIMLAGCSTWPLGDGVGAHERLWREKGSDSYEIVVKYTQDEMQQMYRIVVVKGEATGAERQSSMKWRCDPNGPFEPMRLDAWNKKILEGYTVAGLFRRARNLRSPEHAKFDVTVEYDETLGYPRKIESSAKKDSGILDGYGCVEVVSLKLNPEADK